MRIDGEGFSIREWEVTDAADLADGLDNIRIWNNVRDRLHHPYALEDACSFIGYVQACDRPLDFAIQAEGKAVGGIGIVPMTDVERYSAEIGYWIAEPHWGRGIASRAVEAFTRFVFSETEFVRLFAHVFSENRASRRVLEKAGYREIGTARKAAFKNGRFRDYSLYECVKG